MDSPVPVLLVDDHPSNLLALEALLGDPRLDLVRAMSGEQALRLLADRDFAVVLLDLQMPGLSGFETTQRIRAADRARDTPVIFVTSHDEADFPVREAYAVGAVDYLTKPLIPEVLRAKVGVFVELFRKAEQVRELERGRGENALRASEARFRAVVEKSYDVVGLVAADGTVHYVSPSCLAVSGYTADELLGRNALKTLVHPDDLPGVWAGFQDLLANPGSAESATYRIRHKEGSWRWVEVRRTNLLDDAAVGAMVVNMRDVTDRIAAGEALRDADRRKDEFLATLAHELRNPLAPITNALEIMRLGGGLSPTAEKARALVERQVDHMVRLVNDLLDVSRISRGKITLHRQRLDLRDVARAAAETNQPLMAACRHEWSADVPDDPVWVEGDQFRLTQVVSNLLNNSAKYTPTGGRVRLSVAGEGVEGVIRVADSGVGIRPDDLARVFVLFTQVAGHEGRLTQGGLGIGLALVKRLVELHGGTVEARSEGPGRGSEFVIRLPLIAVNE